MNVTWLFCGSNQTLNSILVDNNARLNQCFLQLAIELPIYFTFLLYNAYLYGFTRAITYQANYLLINLSRLCVLAQCSCVAVEVFLKFFQFYSSLTFNDVIRMAAVTVHFVLTLNKAYFVSKQRILCFFWFYFFIIFNNFVLFVNLNLYLSFSFDLNVGFMLGNMVLSVVYLCLLFAVYNWLMQTGVPIRPDGYERLDDDGVGTSDEDKSTYFSYLTFNWLDRIIKKGYRNELQSIEQLNNLPASLNLSGILKNNFKFIKTNDFDHNANPILNPDQLNERLFSYTRPTTSHTTQDHHQIQTDSYKISILWLLYKSHGRQFIFLGFVKFLNDLLQFSGPLLLNQLIQYIDNKNFNLKLGVSYAGGLFATTLITTFLNVHFSYSLNKLCLKIKSFLITLVYRKVLVINLNELNRHYSIGKIVNFMSIDVDTLVNLFPSIHSFWSLPLQIVITLYLLYTQIGLSFICGFIFVIILIPINKFLSDYIGKVHTKLMEFKDSRIKVMTEFLRGIRVIKFNGWENYFQNKINSIRENELSKLRAKKYLDAFCVYFWASTPILISVCTFMTYVYLGNELTPSKVFTSLALFNMLITPLNSFPWVINGLVQAFISLKRIQNYLNIKNLNWYSYYSLTDGGVGERRAATADTVLLDVDNVTFKVVNNDQEDDSNDEFKLRQIKFKLQKGSLIGVIGKVGQGKTTFLNSLIGELYLEQDGSRVSIDESVLKNGFAYVTQEYWIEASTIKENILFGLEYDDEKYKRIIYACALEHDLKQLPYGDQTPIGDNGITLSGGQKLRLCLARACYQDKEVYLLDDPLSAVDTHVAKHLYENCINGYLAHKTRVLCTHHLSYLFNCDHLYVMEEGRFVRHGLPGDILKDYLNSFKVMTEDQDTVVDVMTHSDTATANVELKEMLDDLKDKNADDEEKENGVIRLRVYKYYCVAIGVCLTFTALLSLVLMQASRNLTDWWLSYWTQHHLAYNQTITANTTTWTYVLNPSVTNVYYGDSFMQQPNRTATSNMNELKIFFIVYGVLCGSNSIFTLIRAFSFAYSCIIAGKYIHNCLIDSLMKAPMKFYDRTPRGRILNRLSSDMYTIDDSLPFILNIFLACTVGLTGIVVVTSYSLPWFLVALVPISILYYSIQNYYRWSSRELRRFTAISLSPIYQNFHDTINGLLVIRTFRHCKRFLLKNEDYLLQYIRSSYVSTAASQWLNIRLQLLGVVMITCVSFIGVLQHVYLGAVNASLIGLALSYILSVTGLLNGLITTFTETEKEMISVERTYQFKALDKENLYGSVVVDQSWPLLGSIQFIDVCLRYGECPNYALEDLNLTIIGGEKVGVVGRTGSGKSSIFASLFRLVELNSGVIFIDGINIRDLDLLRLRTAMSIITQDSFLFNSTLRENIDPYGLYSDLEVRDVLNKCKLNSFGLDYTIEENGKNLSCGQRQLICLARALLCRTKILCIDEATASIDYETDNYIQEILRTQFQAVTIITIAHRINTIFDYDKVMVMQNGKLLEFDTINSLLANKNSYFKQLVDSEYKTIRKHKNTNSVH